jgi:hypothetical protein
VELTPDREYLLVTEFFAGAVELGEATVDDQVIDDGLSIIRKLWDAGLAHRDIKPACWSATAACASSTWPLPRPAPAPGGRRSTCKT